MFLPLTYGALNGKLGWHNSARCTEAALPPKRTSHAAPDAIVLLCEGEKAADAAQRIFPDYVGVSWMGGARADASADLSPLKDRTVFIWPDADQVGRDAAARLAERLPGARIIDTANLPDGFDAADLERLDEDPFAWLVARLPPPEAALQAKLGIWDAGDDDYDIPPRSGSSEQSSAGGSCRLWSQMAVSARPRCASLS